MEDTNEITPLAEAIGDHIEAAGDLPFEYRHSTGWDAADLVLGSPEMQAIRQLIKALGDSCWDDCPALDKAWDDLPMSVYDWACEA